MLVTHSLEGKRISKGVFENVGFLLTNRNGGFFNTGINTKYRGMFIPMNGDIYKIIDDIRIKGNVNEIRNNFFNALRCRENNTESFFMPFGNNSLVYELNNDDEIDVFFDMKKAYDSRTWGRNYNAYIEKDKAIIEFSKCTDSREDSTNGNPEFSMCAVIDPIGIADIKLLNEWENQYYDFDKARNSNPYERYTFKGVRIRSKGFILSAAPTKEEALHLCKRISGNMEKFKSLQKEYAKVSLKDFKEQKIDFAAKCAVEALDGLISSSDANVNMYAGLPWFFQYWSRDTLISLKALMIDKEYDTVKKILMNYLHNISEDGLLPNRVPETVTKSADAIGWYLKRWDEFITILRHEKQLKNYFKKSEILFIMSKLEESMNKIFQTYTLDNLSINGKQETWMDTDIGHARMGARIEIQALRICMYEFMHKLSEKKVYKDVAEKLKAKTRDVFWNGEYLIDGQNDSTIRPNVFIAAYLCPDLLSNEEWAKCFEIILPRLWLSWGGLSTIDLSDKKFVPYNTGENPASYHNGDSWYFVNNLAAIAMHRVDKHKFKPYIDKIIDASCNDILFKGFIGCHSEISSAMNQEAWGCLSQAWSNATFIELADELFIKH